MIRKIFGGETQVNNSDQFGTPDRRGLNYTDTIRRSVDRPYSRAGLNQSQAYPYEGNNQSNLFGIDIPDPSHVKSNTRDTLTVRDVL